MLLAPLLPALPLVGVHVGVEAVFEEIPEDVLEVVLALLASSSVECLEVAEDVILWKLPLS